MVEPGSVVVESTPSDVVGGLNRGTKVSARGSLVRDVLRSP